MLKAGALIYAIFISFLIALTSSSVIFLAFAGRVQADRAFTSDRLIRNAKSGMELLMSTQTVIPIDSKKLVDLFGAGCDSVLLQKTSWGLFNVVSSRAFSKREQSTKIALIGSAINKKDNIAIYLANTKDKSLSVCGKTIIKGDCFLPPAGAKKAKIELQDFIGTILINGQTLKSETDLPVLGQELMSRIKLLEDGKFSYSDSVKDIRFLAHDSVKQSFSLQTACYYSANPIVLDKKYIEGKVVIRSSKSITLKASCHISNALFFAPKIIIEDGFAGNLQAFASDTLLVGKKCRLAFPSVLAIYRTDASAKSIRLIIGEDVTCLGIVIGIQHIINPTKALDLIISKDDIIYGQVYCLGNVELKGSVFGSLYCTKFIVRTPSSLYENHLLNSQVDISKQPEEYAGICIQRNGIIDDKRIIRWLD